MAGAQSRVRPFLHQGGALSFFDQGGGLQGESVASSCGPAHLALLPEPLPRPLFRSVPRCLKGRRELRRIYLPSTSVNKASENLSVGYIEPLQGRETLSREGASR